MSTPLEEYRRKRDFAKTAEPSGAPSEEGGAGEPEVEGLSFVIHKHAASRLHYDLRLELDGVLLSWAVPKGPSLDPADKRLAMHVEDHPIEYGGFEGTIPKGEYGAGAVVLWDRGTWRPLDGDPDAAREGLSRGTLKFTLSGEKLTGAWMLVRMKPRPGERGESWLLIKERDAAARPHGEYDVLAVRPESVASGRTIEEVASAGTGADADEPGWQDGPAAPVPADAPVQLATLSGAPPEGPQWLHEIKYDGYRLRIALAGGAARAYTRGGEEWSERFPALVRAASKLPAREALLDGEAVVFGSKGVPDFGALQEALSAGATDDVVYLAFDLLGLDGDDLRDRPLLERKRLLADLLTRAGAGIPLRFADHVEGRGGDFFTAACALGLEGSVSKRSSAPYRPGRTGDWRKSPCTARQEFVVVGATSAHGSRAGFGSLLLGVHDDEGHLAYTGRVGTGFRERDLASIAAELETLQTDAPPPGLADAVGRVPGRSIRWVAPELVIEVGFAGWTGSGKLRHPRFLGVRRDRDPRSVRREEPGGPRPETHQEGPPARLTRPDKELFPPGESPGRTTAGVTKADLVAYYREVAPAMLPHLAGRPLSIVRCPHGRTAECFFQKHPDRRSWPPQLETFEMTERDGETATYFFLTDAEGLAALVQLGVLEVHAWNSLHTSPDTPDRIVFDLDPGPDVPAGEVREAAFTIRDELASFGMTGFVKTTGGRGLHVVAPLVRDPAIGYETARGFARGLVERLAAREPDRFTARMAKAARTGRIFLDYLRNAHGATAVASYSTRARPGAPVSVPLTWEELAEHFDPGAFDILSVPGRLARLAGADPWSGYERARVPLPPQEPG